MDITELILTQHHEQRRTFALLDELAATTPTGLAAVWERLAVLLEVHAEAEEKFFYPRLLEVGTGGGDGPTAWRGETKDAIKDHNEIRDAIAEAAEARGRVRGMVGGGTRSTTSPTATTWPRRRRGRTSSTSGSTPTCKYRHDIAVQFIVFENQHAARGVTPHDEDPDTYVAEHN